METTPDFGQRSPPEDARRDRRRRGGLLVALGFLIPLGVTAMLNFVLLDAPLFSPGSDLVFALYLVVIPGGVVLSVIGLAMIWAAREARDSPARTEARDIDAALDAAIEEDEASGEPVIELDAPTGLPWERR